MRPRRLLLKGRAAFATVAASFLALVSPAAIPSPLLPAALALFLRASTYPDPVSARVLQGRSIGTSKPHWRPR
ncbi:hypothetical protein ACFV3N_05620 [Streptomyces bauhiniae]|uniref:hypothetical protein n=1 Tax=Streptomyces bauhiniae TaxID=2340725 RepID=UPI0036532D1B